MLVQSFKVTPLARLNFTFKYNNIEVINITPGNIQ